MKMLNKVFILICLYFFLSSIDIIAQLSIPTLPFSILHNLSNNVLFYTVPSEILNSQTDKSHSCQFAKTYRCSITPENAGTWEQTPEGWVWRLGITSSNAFSLYLTFQQFRLEKNANIFVYSPNYKEHKGAFTSRNNHDSGIFSIAPLRGDSLIVELNIRSQNKQYGQFQIAKVYHDFTNAISEINALSKARLQQAEQNCSVSINSQAGSYWQTEKRATCKVIINDLLCSGTLIGNTSNDKTPYLLTAFHCVRDSLAFLETIIFLNYESNERNSLNTVGNQTLSGATLVAYGGTQLDFALLKLHEIPPPHYQPYYAGWDRGTHEPQKGICIHHPEGKPKEICFEFSPLTTGNYGAGFLENSVWKIEKWDLGVPRGGSSGAALFNENHRLVGNFMGGSSTCQNPTNDYFVKFNLSWDYFKTPNKNLKAWLDNAQKEESYINGYNPYGVSATPCDTTSNIKIQEKVILTQTANGYVSGSNNLGISQFSEKFNSSKLLEISGFYFNIAKNNFFNSFSNILVKIWRGADVPQTEIYSQRVYLQELRSDEKNYFTLDSTLSVEGNFFIGFSFEKSFPTDEFAIYHTPARNSAQATSMNIFKNNQWYRANQLGPNLSTSLDIGVITCNGKPERVPVASIQLYPNPCKNYIDIDIPENEIIEKVMCFDMTGREIATDLYMSESQNRLFFEAQNAVYLIKIFTNKGAYSQKILVQK